ncbi:MAG: hypothetical protein HUJ29_00585 [Gammaproteobacteria bacterium]|nr:hypothetical protein [Gammaproteobacteria bacterium]
MKYVVIELTEGNINNHHLYLSSVIEFFPKTSIGGSNSKEEASELLEIHSGIEQPVLTDIAGDKKIFRKRSWVREFFEVHDIKPGDRIIIEHTGGNRYHVYPVRTL